MNHDMTFCKTEKCPVKDRCLRGEFPKEAVMVSMSFFQYHLEGNKLSCEHFIPKPEKE